MALSLNEIATTLHEMVEDKVPSLDAFHCEFYKASWEFVGSNLLQVYHEAFHKQSLDAKINQGLIKFIPKARDLKIIINWRPITQCSIHPYKILAKALCLRKKYIIPNVIALNILDSIGEDIFYAMLL